VRWFDLARRSTDPKIAGEALKAWQGLRRSQARLRTTVWVFPVFSTRWHDLFSYGQYKTEWRARFPLHLCVSTRFVGDTRVTIGAVSPQFLLESSFILGLGVTSWDISRLYSVTLGDRSCCGRKRIGI